MIAILVLVVAFFASVAGQSCNQLVPKDVVRTRRNQLALLEPANSSDPVIFSCTTLTNDRSGYAAATAYIANVLLDYRCMEPDGWEAIADAEKVTEVYIRDIEDGMCSDCVPNSRDLQAGPEFGHCQRCGDGCATCGIGSCFTCMAGYSLSDTTCAETTPAPGVTSEVLAIIIVCSVLGLVFIVLAVAAVALVVYIVTFTRTETIAHRKLKSENQPVAYRRRQNIGTYRNNPMFGAAEGWGNPTFTDSPEDGWTNPLAPRRPPLRSMQIADSNEEEGEIDDKQVGKVTEAEAKVEYDEYDDY